MRYLRVNKFVFSRCAHRVEALLTSTDKHSFSAFLFALWTFITKGKFCSLLIDESVCQTPRAPNKLLPSPYRSKLLPINVPSTLKIIRKHMWNDPLERARKEAPFELAFVIVYPQHFNISHTHTRPPADDNFVSLCDRKLWLLLIPHSFGPRLYVLPPRPVIMLTGEGKNFSSFYGSKCSKDVGRRDRARETNEIDKFLLFTCFFIESKLRVPYRAKGDEGGALFCAFFLMKAKRKT